MKQKVQRIIESKTQKWASIAFFGDIYKQFQKLDSEASLKGSKSFKRGMTRPSFECESAPS